MATLREKQLCTEIARAVKADQPERAAELRRDLRLSQAERYIRDLVATWPPLTEAQRVTLARLFSAGGS